MTDKQIIIDGCDVSGCCQYMPRYMEDYDIDTLDYCRYHFKPCKDVDVKYCYYKQLKRKEQECEKANKNAQDTYDLYQALMESFNILQGEKIKLKQQLDQLKVKCKSLEDISGRLQKQNHELTLENEKLEQYKASKQVSYEQLQKRCNELELENRKLKERLDQWISKCEQETKLKEFHKNKTDEYKNTLLYIKEIAEVQQSWNEVNRQSSETEFEDDIFAYNWSALKQILNKISEVIKR